MRNTCIIFILVPLLFGCVAKQKRVEEISEVKSYCISFDVQFPYDIGDELEHDNPYILSDSNELIDIRKRINGLKKSNERYVSNSYVRCIVIDHELTKYELLCNRYLISFDNETFEIDTALLKILCPDAERL